jgi:Uma2 family endonuclease
LSLYSRQGVREYWIVDWQRHRVDVFRLADGALQLAEMLGDPDTLTSPLLPGFGCPVASLWPAARP